MKSPSAVPLCGFPKGPELRVQLVEEGVVANHAAWSQAYEARGCKSSRDKRRMHRALAHAFNGLRVSDRDVVLLLGDLAACAEDTPIRHAVLSLVVEFKALCPTKLQPDTPAWECLRRLLELKVDPAQYNEQQVHLYASDVQLVKFLSKYPFIGAKMRAEEVAIEKLLKQESLNALTNHRWTLGDFSDGELSQIEAVTHQLELILGPAPTPVEVLEKAAWGPGTVVGNTYGGGMTGPEFKFAQKATLTPNLTSVAPWVVTHYPEWSASMLAINQHDWFRVVPGDVLFTVPKKFEESRCAMKQAMINIWLTRGIGRTILKRLHSRAGLDLLHQQGENRRLARIGSGTGIFCTLDLTSASDSVCRAPLRSVLSPAWFAWLYSTAARRFRLPTGYTSVGFPSKTTYRDYEMMSSMGCGFTFELQTALFLAICRSVVPGQWVASTRAGGRCELRYPHIGVNGDDIIVPTAYAKRVIELLTLFGLTVNVNKSHYNAAPGFRESCGGDYLFGVPVRPLFLHKGLDDGSAIVRLANNVLSKAVEVRENHCGDSRFGVTWYRSLHRRLVGFIPTFICRLISTPPEVPNGLWGRCTSSRGPDTLTGQPDNYRVLVATPSVVKLGEVIIWGENPEAWPLSLTGANLFAARLSSLGSDPAERWKWDPRSRIGMGEVSTLGHAFSTEVEMRSRHGYGQWHGWQPLSV